jgi:hypothetical protein
MPWLYSTILVELAGCTCIGEQGGERQKVEGRQAGQEETLGQVGTISINNSGSHHFKNFIQLFLLSGYSSLIRLYFTIIHLRSFSPFFFAMTLRQNLVPYRNVISNLRLKEVLRRENQGLKVYPIDGSSVFSMTGTYF